MNMISLSEMVNKKPKKIKQIKQENNIYYKKWTTNKNAKSAKCPTAFPKKHAHTATHPPNYLSVKEVFHI